MISSPGRRAFTLHSQWVVSSSGGFTFVLADTLPNDTEWELKACDALHNGAAPTNVAIGLIDKLSNQVLLVSSGTTVGPIAANAPIVVAYRPVAVPPGYNLFAVAQNLAAGESLTLRAIYAAKELS